MDKKQIYDRICMLLTEYENPKEYDYRTTADDLYQMLVEVVNNFEYITSTDDD